MATTDLSRRSLLGGLGLLIAAPAVIRTPGVLMPVKTIASSEDWFYVVGRDETANKTGHFVARGCGLSETGAKRLINVTYGYSPVDAFRLDPSHHMIRKKEAMSGPCGLWA